MPRCERSQPRRAERNQPRLMFMMSSGGLTAAHLFQGKDAILSGPAGGVVGATETAKMAGFGRVIGFDMGGTSTDVSHFDGELERTFETEVAGVRMRAPMMRIHTVAAGGGSILFYEAGRFRVGPQSAGANPGPASYRRGGPLTVTDANVMVGKLVPELLSGDLRREPGPAARFRHRAREIRAARQPRSAMGERPRRSRTASCRWRSRTWRTPSRRSRSRAAMTSRNTRSPASAEPAASTHA